MEKKGSQNMSVPASEAARILGIPVGSLANMRWAKCGPRYIKAGNRRILYRLSDLAEWLEKNVVLTTDNI